MYVYHTNNLRLIITFNGKDFKQRQDIIYIFLHFSIIIFYYIDKYTIVNVYMYTCIHLN
jgi:hypothetical protein